MKKHKTRKKYIKKVEETRLDDKASFAAKATRRKNKMKLMKSLYNGIGGLVNSVDKKVNVSKIVVVCGGE